ncbi:Adhesion G-Protein Coupled Receptor D2 [Manis pentadactyla]|nr:Adhesion G-Protein Coupled Receptor D2 [Manis pentadactyla]
MRCVKVSRNLSSPGQLETIGTLVPTSFLRPLEGTPSSHSPARTPRQIQSGRCSDKSSLCLRKQNTAAPRQLEFGKE